MRKAVCPTGPVIDSLTSRPAAFKQIKANVVKTLIALLFGVSSLGASAIAQTAGTCQATNILSDGSVPALNPTVSPVASAPTTPGTQASVQTVTITATSGNITQNTTIALTVQ
jgi:hypothetical protein